MREPYKLSYKEKTRESATLCVYNCGEQVCRASDAWGEGVRDHYLIHYVRSGAGYYKTGDTVYALGAGDLFIVYPATPIRYWADNEDPWAYDWVGFNGGEAGYLLRRTDFSRSRPVLHCTDPRVAQAMRAVTEACGGKLYHQTRMIGRLYEFLSLLLELAAPAAACGEDGYDYVGGATRFIARNYAAPIDVSTVAQNIGVSRSHLYRVFMRSMGVTPGEYLTHFRISQSCELLAGGSLPIGAVANSVGYEDPLYFSRVFRRVMGESPRQWAARRRETRRKDSPNEENAADSGDWGKNAPRPKTDGAREGSDDE